MTATPTPLRELPAKWRKLSDAKYPRGNEAREMAPEERHDIEGRCEQLDECADELDAALSARDEAGAVGHAALPPPPGAQP